MMSNFMEGMKNNKKKVIITAGAIILAGAIGTGVYMQSTEPTTVASKPASVSISKEAANKISNPELIGKVDIKDKVVLQNSKKVDFKKLAKVQDKEAVKEIKVDDSNVNTAKTGKYIVKYEITLNPVNKETKAETTKEETKTEAKTETKTETAKAEATTAAKEETSSDEKTLTAEIMVTVVDEKEAKELVAKGEEVIVSDNKVVTTEKQVAEAVSEIKGTEETTEVAKADDKSEKKADTKKEETKTQTATSQTTTTKAESKVHVHNWVQQYTTVKDYTTVTDYEDQPVYENQPVYATAYHYICNCGVDCGNDRTAHISTGCLQGYSVQPVKVQTGTTPVQVGTQRVPVGTHQEECGSHQEPAGFKCSCGAAK